MDGRPVAVLLIATSTVLAVRALLGSPEPGGRASVVPRAVEVGARVPVPARFVRGAAPADAAVAAAGWDRDIDAAGVARARAAGLAAGLGVALAALAAWPPGAAVGLAAAAAGWWWPGRLMRRAARTRGAAMRRQLPDLMDVLGLCVATGMAADPALREASRRLRGPLAAEVRRALEDIDLGTPRRTAYAELGARVPCEAMGRLINALADAEDLGAPLADTLRTQARRAREDAVREARGAAATAAPRIQLVIALVMVPAALLMVLAVMGTELVRQVAPVFAGLG